MSFAEIIVQLHQRGYDFLETQEFKSVSVNAINEIFLIMI